MALPETPAHKRIVFMEYAREVISKAKWNLARSDAPEFPLAEIGISLQDLFRPLTLSSTGYGYEEIHRALGAYFRVDPDWVFRALGTSDANFVLMQTLLERGDEVIIERPTYEPLLKIAQLIGCRIQRLDRRPEDGWRVDCAALRKLVTPATRMVILTNLHNPSGVRIPDETLREAGDIAAGAGAHLFVDEVYLDLVDGATPETLPRRIVDLAPTGIGTGSLTKCYGLGALRFGWIFARPDVIRECHRFNNMSYVHGPAEANNLGLAAMAIAPRLLQRAQAARDANLGILKQWAAAHPELHWTAPAGGFIGYFRLPDGMRSLPLLDHAMNRYQTNFAPGHYFEDDRFLRLAVGGGAPETIRESLNRLGAAIGDLQHGK